MFKSIVSVIAAFLSTRTRRSNFMVLVKLLVLLLVLVIGYSIAFHFIMEREGQDHSWLTGLYWTMVMMSTLGLGDITFESDLGRGFSIMVLGTGVMFLLVLLPFTFIEFFYAPWMQAQSSARSPREVPPGTRGHVIFTEYNEIHDQLRRQLNDRGVSYFILVGKAEEALALDDRDVPAVVGEHHDPKTWEALNVGEAAMVVTTRSDVINTNVTFTVREVSETVPVVSTASSAAARDALELAGVTHILRLEEMMGEALARRVNAGEEAAHVIGELKGITIAEAPVDGTDMIGKSLRESGLREDTGVTVIGLWKGGALHPVDPAAPLTPHCMLVMAGTSEQIAAYNERMATRRVTTGKVVIVGSGVVGLSTGAQLAERGLEYTIIEKSAVRQIDREHTIQGDASNFDLLVKAGLHEAATVIITTHDDEINLFLTIFYRRLRRGLQIISRCARASYAEKLQRAGADLVLSYSSMVANTLMNHLRKSDSLVLAEGLNAFTVSAPDALVGLTLADSNVRSRTGCSVIAIDHPQGGVANPGAGYTILPDSTLVLIGSLDAEDRFRDTFQAS